MFVFTTAAKLHNWRKGEAKISGRINLSYQVMRSIMDVTNSFSLVLLPSLFH